MNKIILMIIVPALGKEYEMKVPRQLKVKQLTDALSAFFENADIGSFYPKEAVLCDAASGRNYNSNAFIEQLGLKNGDKMLFI